jgi:hypothetical protein
MIRWYVSGPKGWGWPGRCRIDDATPANYTYYDQWPDLHVYKRGTFNEPLESLLANRKWVELMDPDLEVDEGL